MPLFAAFEYPGKSSTSFALAGSALAGGEMDGFLLNPALGITPAVLYASLNYTRLYNQASLEYMSGAALIPIKSAAAGIHVQSLGGPLYRESAMGLSFARRLGSESIAAGIALYGYSVSATGYSSLNGYGVHAGIQYKLHRRITAGAVAENLVQSGFVSGEEELPRIYGLAMGFQADDRMDIYLAVRKERRYQPEVLAGISYQLSDTLRLLGGFASGSNQPSVGMELTARHLRISYTVQNHFDLGPTHMAGLAFVSL